MYFKVCLGSRRYTTEHVDYICAATAEEACARAIKLNKGMRYAVAQAVKLSQNIVEKILSEDGCVYCDNSKISFFGHDGYLVDFSNGCSLLYKDKFNAIFMFLNYISNEGRVKLWR